MQSPVLARHAVPPAGLVRMRAAAGRVGPCTEPPPLCAHGAAHLTAQRRALRPVPVPDRAEPGRPRTHRRWRCRRRVGAAAWAPNAAAARQHPDRGGGVGAGRGAPPVPARRALPHPPGPVIGPAALQADSGRAGVRRGTGAAHAGGAGARGSNARPAAAGPQPAPRPRRRGHRHRPADGPRSGAAIARLVRQLPGGLGCRGAGQGAAARRRQQAAPAAAGPHLRGRRRGGGARGGAARQQHAAPGERGGSGWRGARGWG
eukprot:scaffold15633_cov107-Isochrysis_galbana.AAC.8